MESNKSHLHHHRIAFKCSRTYAYVGAAILTVCMLYWVLVLEVFNWNSPSNLKINSNKTWDWDRPLNDMEDWLEGNLLRNGQFIKGTIGRKPCLSARGKGQWEEYAYVFQSVSLVPSRWYILRVRFRVQNIYDVNMNLVHAVVGSANVMITKYKLEGRGEYILVSDFSLERMDGLLVKTNFRQHKSQAQKLYFKYSPLGQVWWDRISLIESVPQHSRPVTVAVAWYSGNYSWWSNWLDFAGEHGVDIALLPEFMNNKDPSDAEDIVNGPTFQLLSQKAKQWKMYTSTSIYEKRGHLIFNTAPLYDRKGDLVSTYEKNQLYEPEAEKGVTPGSEYKTYHADFGIIGFATCYDSWFPEVFRLLSYKGAELVLFPSQSYYKDIMPARASDFGLWIAAASQGTSAGIWDSGGTSCDELSLPPEQRSMSRRSPTSILSCKLFPHKNMLIGTIDLNKKFSPHWYGTGEGPFRSAPGGHKARQSLIIPIEEQIAREARNWQY